MYEIISLAGAGGMGEVHRARDTKLGRDVAVKVLHDAMAADPERIARFEREAKVLASLNHHNIAALFGMEEADGRHFLIMELVEGETLAEKIRHGSGLMAMAEANHQPSAISHQPSAIARASHRRSSRDRAADRRRPRSGARERHRPSRPQAGEHQDHAGRQGQGARLWFGEDA